VKRKKEKVQSAKRRTICLCGNYRPCVFLLSFSLYLLCGCADKKSATTRPLTMRERQDAQMNDPFGYKDDVPTVTGGKTGEFDKKSFDRDMDRVFNP
jgi:hypothetical protein